MLSYVMSFPPLYSLKYFGYIYDWFYVFQKSVVKCRLCINVQQSNKTQKDKNNFFFNEKKSHLQVFAVGLNQNENVKILKDSQNQWCSHETVFDGEVLKNIHKNENDNV